MSKRTKAKAARESDKSYILNNDWRYYENEDSITVFNWTANNWVRIPYTMLRATLARADGTAKPRKMLQSARTGRAVSKAYAAKNPATTFRQAVGKGRGRRA